MNNFPRILQKIDNSKFPSLVTFLNPYSYLILRRKKILRDIDTIFIDGIVFVYLLRLIGIRTNRKSFDMTSLAPKVFQKCIKENTSIYFIGSTEDAIGDFVNIILKKFPKLKIVGQRNGYFNNKNCREEALSTIINLRPNVVVVGMGTPYQEQFLVDLAKGGWSGQGYTCGGFIHQTAKGINYYPAFYNKYNLRWLYRIIDEPKLFRRYAILYPKAIMLFFLDYLKHVLNE